MERTKIVRGNKTHKKSSHMLYMLRFEFVQGLILSKSLGFSRPYFSITKIRPAFENPGICVTTNLQLGVYFYP